MARCAAQRRVAAGVIPGQEYFRQEYFRQEDFRQEDFRQEYFRQEDFGQKNSLAGMRPA
jgi:hypothetical protein